MNHPISPPHPPHPLLARRPPPVTFTAHPTPPNAAKTSQTLQHRSIAAHTALPRGKRKPSTVHTSSHLAPAVLETTPPVTRPRRPTTARARPPYRSHLITPARSRPFGLSRQLSDFPTSRLPDKSKSWQVGKHHHPLTTSTTQPPALAAPSGPAHPGPPERRPYACTLYPASPVGRGYPPCISPPRARPSADTPLTISTNHRPRSPDYPAGRPLSPR